MIVYILMAVSILMMFILSIEEYGYVNKFYAEIDKRCEQDWFVKNWNKGIFIFFVVYFWLLTAFRGRTIGNDTQNYIMIFKNFCDGPSPSSYIELGFQLFCSFVGHFSKDPQVFLIIHATVCYVAVAIYCLKYSKNLMFSLIFIFVLCFYDFTNILRQSLALIIVMYAYQQMKNKNDLTAILMIFLASYFHESAICALILFAYRLFNCNFWVALVLFVCVCVLSLRGVFTNIIAAIMPKYLGYLSGEHIEGGLLGNTYYILRGIVFFAFAYHAYQGKKEKKAERWLFFCVTVVYCFSFESNAITRLGAYFFYPMISELPNVFEEGKFKYKGHWQTIISFVMIMFLLFVLKFRPGWNNLYPYYFWIG